MPARYRRLFLIVAKSLVTTIIFFIGAEIALRTAYAVRNAMVRLVPLPYAIGDEYGPLPPWLDRLEILVPDEGLIWRGERRGPELRPARIFLVSGTAAAPLARPCAGAGRARHRLRDERLGGRRLPRQGHDCGRLGAAGSSRGRNSRTARILQAAELSG